MDIDLWIVLTLTRLIPTLPDVNIVNFVTLLISIDSVCLNRPRPAATAPPLETLMPHLSKQKPRYVPLYASAICIHFCHQQLGILVHSETSLLLLQLAGLSSQGLRNYCLVLAYWCPVHPSSKLESKLLKDQKAPSCRDLKMEKARQPRLFLLCCSLPPAPYGTMPDSWGTWWQLMALDTFSKDPGSAQNSRVSPLDPKASCPCVVEVFLSRVQVHDQLWFWLDVRLCSWLLGSAFQLLD